MDYTSKRWQIKRKKILKKDGYIDRYAFMYGKIIEATLVHHIYPAKEYPEYSYEDWNLISISFETHNKLENRKTGKLTKLGEELKKNTKVGIDWRSKKNIPPL